MNVLRSIARKHPISLIFALSLLTVDAALIVTGLSGWGTVFLLFGAFQWAAIYAVETRVPVRR